MQIHLLSSSGLLLAHRTCALSVGLCGGDVGFQSFYRVVSWSEEPRRKNQHTLCRFKVVHWLCNTVWPPQLSVANPISIYWLNTLVHPGRFPCWVLVEAVVSNVKFTIWLPYLISVMNSVTGNKACTSYEWRSQAIIKFGVPFWRAALEMTWLQSIKENQSPVITTVLEVMFLIMLSDNVWRLFSSRCHGHV